MNWLKRNWVKIKVSGGIAAFMASTGFCMDILDEEWYLAGAGMVVMFLSAYLLICALDDYFGFTQE